VNTVTRPPRRSTRLPPRRARLASGVALGLVLLGTGVAGGPAGLGAKATAAERPSDAAILAIVKTHCVPCHAAEPTHEAFAKPPAGIMLETIEQISRHAPRIITQVVVERAMPLGNQTGMTDEERAQVGAWIESRTQ